MVRTIPLKNITAATVSKDFCGHWVFQYGPRAHLLSDNGGQFTAKFFQDVCAILGVRKLLTTAYHPQTNGQVERFNRTILAGLRREALPLQWTNAEPSLRYAFAFSTGHTRKPWVDQDHETVTRHDNPIAATSACFRIRAPRDRSAGPPCFHHLEALPQPYHPHPEAGPIPLRQTGQSRRFQTPA